nr:immunoglobulin light chain junction region [Macaca mulatta]
SSAWDSSLSSHLF